MNSVTPLFGNSGQVVFVRQELDQLMQLYGRMVAAGHWRDYAIDLGREVATFSAFRRASERPEYRVVKDPSLRLRQGQFALVSEIGATLKRGNDLAVILAPVSRKLMKLVD
ncbi:DUF2794 domain-containing protein [Sandaracinobacteroides hominis]|uniref:DUF2794 domain-containing protein n=1 Tax=Sandaracinobacteroides hominis TaxID=2780086 RepID=UPI0018F2F9C4|nr:DUF2794 domain-containing protein [Sandaracinobacteroides hominis]